MQTNDLGIDELMTLCRLIGVDPYITVNAGLAIRTPLQKSRIPEWLSEYVDGFAAREERASATLQREDVEHGQ